MLNVSRFEEECNRLFGECPLNIHDIKAGNECCYSEQDFMKEAARKIYIKHQKDFSNELHNWMNGNKKDITEEEAAKLNKWYNNAVYILDDENVHVPFTPLNWNAFPNDNPEIVFYIGYPLDCDLCQWASKYLDEKKCS